MGAVTSSVGTGPVLRRLTPTPRRPGPTPDTVLFVGLHPSCVAVLPPTRASSSQVREGRGRGRRSPGPVGEAPEFEGEEQGISTSTRRTV